MLNKVLVSGRILSPSEISSHSQFVFFLFYFWRKSFVGHSFLVGENFCPMKLCPLRWGEFTIKNKGTVWNKHFNGGILGKNKSWLFNYSIPQGNVILDSFFDLQWLRKLRFYCIMITKINTNNINIYSLWKFLMNINMV